LFSLAEQVVAVCREAALAALEESIDTQAVHWRHWEKALKEVVPQTSIGMLDFYRQFREQRR
jgi:AAA family ATPase